MNVIRPSLLFVLAALPWSDCAAQAVSTPLTQAPVVVRAQPLASGAVTHQVQLPAEPGQAAVVVRSIQPDSVIGNYRIDFDLLDVDGDGFISRDEARANPALADEFDSLDSARHGKLAREQLAGWL
ncbi:MAG: EF-hand domain-containing protein [Stenotrophomonas sp.]